jgi:hypothetical protein
VQEDYGSGLRYLFQYISLIANMEYNASNSLATVRSPNTPKCKEGLAQHNLLSFSTEPMGSEGQIRLQSFTTPHITGE